jgi:hypothetical protein
MLLPQHPQVHTVLIYAQHAIPHPAPLHLLLYAAAYHSLHQTGLLLEDTATTQSEAASLHYTLLQLQLAAAHHAMMNSC